MIESVLGLDQQLLLVINAIHTSWLNPIMALLSGQLIWVPFIGYFFWKSGQSNDRNLTLLFALYLLLAIVASDVTSSYVLKNIFQRMRPCRLEELRPLLYQFGQKCGGKFGFVSSHAANSIALVSFSIRALELKGNRIYLLWLLPVLVSWSRVYLGVHYPGDILGGAVIGLLWGYFFSFAFRSRR